MSEGGLKKTIFLGTRHAKDKAKVLVTKTDTAYTACEDRLNGNKLKKLRIRSTRYPNTFISVNALSARSKPFL